LLVALHHILSQQQHSNPSQIHLYRDLSIPNFNFSFFLGEFNQLQA
jgi:hypothetical protein